MKKTKIVLLDMYVKKNRKQLIALDLKRNGDSEYETLKQISNNLITIF